MSTENLSQRSDCEVEGTFGKRENVHVLHEFGNSADCGATDEFAGNRRGREPVVFEQCGKQQEF